MTARSAVDMIDAPEPASAVLHPLRRRILDQLREPDSATGVARRLALPRQKVNYHVRALEKHGLVEAVGERRRGNCVERIVRASAKSYLIGPAALGALAANPETVGDQFSSAYLMALAGQALRDLSELRPKAARAGKRLATLALQSEIRFATVEERHAFTEELATMLARLIARYHDETTHGGRRFRLLLCAYPAPTASTGVTAAAGNAARGNQGGSSEAPAGASGKRRKPGAGVVRGRKRTEGNTRAKDLRKES
jgi:DNA-binding transcriptional ArsR family regulator